MFQALSPEGEEVSEVNLSGPLLISMYRDMVLSRILDGWLLRLQRMGLVGIHAPSEGHEAAYVGTAYALEEGDWVFPLYRELPVYVALKVPLGELISRHLCNAEDGLKGRDFAIYGDKRYRIVPAPVPVSLHIASAVGFALAFKKRGLKHIVMNYFGDGATSKGDFHEALNFAGVFKAPVVFVCVNNQYAISTPFSRQTAAENVAQKAVAYGFEGVGVDGNDVVACYLTATRAVKKARVGGGPTLVEALTYRLGPHTTADDPTRYRSSEEVERWRAKDPIKRVKKYLIDRGLWSEAEDKALWQECEAAVRAEAERCQKIPPVNPAVIFEDVYKNEPWNLAEMKREFISSQ